VLWEPETQSLKQTIAGVADDLLGRLKTEPTIRMSVADRRSTGAVAAVHSLGEEIRYQHNPGLFGFPENIDAINPGPLTRRILERYGVVLDDDGKRIPEHDELWKAHQWVEEIVVTIRQVNPKALLTDLANAIELAYAGPKDDPRGYILSYCGVRAGVTIGKADDEPLKGLPRVRIIAADAPGYVVTIDRNPETLPAESVLVRAGHV